MLRTTDEVINMFLKLDKEYSKVLSDYNMTKRKIAENKEINKETEKYIESDEMLYGVKPTDTLNILSRMLAEMNIKIMMCKWFLGADNLKGE